VQELSESFVPCADEVWRLQRGEDAECLAFRAMADQGHYRGKGGTRQGIYVVSPTGQLLASVNSLNAERVLETMQRGLEAWANLPAEQKIADSAQPGDMEPEHRWEMSYPTEGLVLVSRVRDLPETLDPAGPQATKWNQDHAWFSETEARAVMAAGPAGHRRDGDRGAWVPGTPLFPRPGETWELPREFVERLARFHLVDAVIGQALAFAPEEIVRQSLRAEVMAVEGARVHLSLQGEVLADADGVWRLGDNDWTPRRSWPRGIAWELLGEATWNTSQQSFTTFELVGLGSWWGRSQFNGRGGEDPHGCIGLVLSLAPDVPANRIAPAYIDIYDADWVVRPRDSKGLETRAELEAGIHGVL